jgi:hypothetical protein
MDRLEWLLDSDPAIRWQVMADLAQTSSDETARERSRVAYEGWGARLLSLQTEDGQWGGGVYSPKWISTTYTLLLLESLGAPPDAEPVKTAIERVDDQVTMGGLELPFFSYRGETCIVGMVLNLSSYFGKAGLRSAQTIDWALDEQLEDGGWNCQTVNGSVRSSFNTTLSVLEGLDGYRRAVDAGPEVDAALRRGHEYLLERGLMRSLSTGKVIDSRWKLFSFPPRWHYDVLRALDHFRNADVRDSRLQEAIELVDGKESKDGVWTLQNPHRGRVHFDMEEGAGKPSRWNTLRALRVLQWYGSRAEEPPHP